MKKQKEAFLKPLFRLSIVRKRFCLDEMREVAEH